MAATMTGQYSLPRILKSSGRLSLKFLNESKTSIPTLSLGDKVAHSDSELSRALHKALLLQVYNQPQINSCLYCHNKSKIESFARMRRNLPWLDISIDKLMKRN